MSSDSKGILLGRQPLEKVAAALQATGLTQGAVEVRPDRGSPWMGRLHFADAEASRVLWVHDGAIVQEDVEVYSGERTLVSLGLNAFSAPQIVRGVVAAFGGYAIEDDSPEYGAQWEAVAATVRLDIDPLLQFRIEMDAVLDPKEAEVVRKMLVDKEKLRKFVDAMDRYLAHPASGMGDRRSGA